MNIPWILHVKPCVICGILRCSVHTVDCSYRSVPLVLTQFTLDKGRNSSHSIICKVTCCLFSLFLLHSFYLYLNVLGNLRTNVQDAVKMNCLIFITSCISSTAVKQKPMYLTFFSFFFAFVIFFDTCLTCMCCKK